VREILINRRQPPPAGRLNNFHACLLFVFRLMRVIQLVLIYGTCAAFRDKRGSIPRFGIVPNIWSTDKTAAAICWRHINTQAYIQWMRPTGTGLTRIRDHSLGKFDVRIFSCAEFSSSVFGTNLNCIQWLGSIQPRERVAGFRCKSRRCKMKTFPLC
jgi:hypothetical protein